MARGSELKVKQVLTTEEAAWYLSIDPGNLLRWARRRGVHPLGRVRIGRSWVTRWAVGDIMLLGLQAGVKD